MTGPVVLAAALAGVAVLLAGSPVLLARHRLRALGPVAPPDGFGRGEVPGCGPASDPGSGSHPPAVRPSAGPPSAAPPPAAPSGAAARLVRALPAPRKVRERRAAALRQAGRDLCEGLGDELRAGREPHAALLAALEPLPPSAQRPLAGVGAAARAGAGVAAALRAAGADPGGEPLRRVAVCWEVARGTGAGLAAALERVGEGLAADAALRREVEAQLAGPRATSALLSVLPAAGLALGAGLGGDPLGALLGTGWGRACLVAGLALVALGRWWTGRLARAASP